MKRVPGISVMAFLVFALSCSRPLATENFIRSSEAGAGGVYAYSLDLSDSLTSYSLYFYTRIDSPGQDSRNLPDIGLEADLFSPSGKRYTGRIRIPGESACRSGYFAKDYYFLYRSGFVPSEAGEWLMSVRVEDRDSLHGFRGLGIRLVRHPDNAG